MFNLFINLIKKRQYLFLFSFIMFIYFLLTTNSVNAQFQIRDVYGNKLPTPSWPPPDSLFEDDKFIIWFNRDVTNKQFINDNWYYHYHPPSAIGGNNNTIQSFFSIPGCYDVDLTFLNQLLKDTNLVNFLYGLNLEQFCQVSNFMPIQDSLSFTRNGDTVLTPEFWNCYEVTLSETSPYSPVQAVQTLNIFFGGNQISYAELCSKGHLNSCDFDNSDRPNDVTPISAFLNDEPENDIVYRQNILRAWSLANASNEVKVGIVDSGINPSPDKQNRIGGNYHVIKNSTNYTDPEGHGTGVSGIIGNKNNNGAFPGVAGGCDAFNSDGIIMYNLKLDNEATNLRVYNLADAWLYAIKNTNGNDEGFKVDIVNLSTGIRTYSETVRRILDYGYRLGVINITASGNAGDNLLNFNQYPPMYEQNKILVVGSYTTFRNKSTIENEKYDFIYPVYRSAFTSYGSVLDLLGSGEVGKLQIRTSEYTDDPIILDYSAILSNGTSAASPYVAGVVALMMSKIIEDEPENIDLPLAPEDFEGLLSISAFDCKYENPNSFIDTIGYDEKTGYGVLKADTCLMYMENPYVLRHFTSECGDCEGELVEEKQEFIVIDNDVKFDGLISLAPTSKDIQYVADRYRVSKTISIGDLDIDEGLLKARIWGLGGREPGTDNKTIGWNGVQPRTNVNSYTVYNDEGGYCRVVGNSDDGDSDFNHNNIRDIAYRNNLTTNDVFTIETFVYEVFSATISINGDLTIGNSIDFFPCEPEEVKYRFTVWGETPIQLNIEKNKTSINFKNEINVRCETLDLLNNNILSVYYSMGKFEPVEINVYDLKGNLLKTERKHTWNNQPEQKVYIELNNLNSGIYLIEVKSNSAYGSTKFTFTK